MWKRATVHLTVKYSLLFLAFIWLFSGGLYLWVRESLGQNYVEQVQTQVEQLSGLESPEKREQAAQVAASVAITRFGTILVAVDAMAVFVIPFGAYLITKRTLRPLIEVQEQQKQFVSNASHELRTPLAILNGELELALKKGRNVAYYQNTLASSKAEVEHMIQLTNQLLILNKLDSQKDSRQLVTEKIDLNDTLRRICEKDKSVATVKNISLQVTLTDVPVTMLGNPRLIETALANVLQNAIKYSPENETITVQLVTKSDKTAWVTVENISTNISEHELTMIFERFYQSQHGATGEGFGLGLAIVKSVVELHKGNVHASVSGDKVKVVLVFKLV